MPTYNITAKRETHYEFDIEADTEQEALDEIKRIDSAENVEEYAYEWGPIEITEINETD